VPSGSALLRQSTADSRLHARLRPGAEFPWVEQVAREYGLEWDARQRAAGIARTMASAGYKTAQVMTSDGFERPRMASNCP